MKANRKQKGVTLIEILLVLVISISMLMMFLAYTTQKSDQLRRDRLTMEMQQILNAALVYYVNNGQWPGAATCQAGVGNIINATHPLVTAGYLPNPPAYWNVYGAGFTTCVDSATNNYYLLNRIPTLQNPVGAVIASQLPSGITVVAPTAATLPPFVSSFTQAACSTATGSNSCYIVSMVPIPGQNMNNARSVNFASIYNPGQCVPVPTCPSATMTASILAVPVSVSGVNDNTNGANPPVYPISSLTAYAKGPYAANAVATCPNSANDNCNSATGATQFWRVFLAVTTERGVVSSSSTTDSKNMGSILALTRCVPNAEPSGSTFNVYNP